MTIELEGKLEFTSLFDPIKLFTTEGEVDLREYYFDFFEKLNGKKASMDYDNNSIEIKADDNSTKAIKYQNEGASIIIVLINSTSMSNIGAHLPSTLQTLNGRKVIVSVSENCIKMTNDPDEIVYGLYYTHDNDCKIPDDKIEELCKPGTDAACIFCTVSANGFECKKFNTYFARQILYRYSEKTLRAARIGDCAILGRKEPGDNI